MHLQHLIVDILFLFITDKCSMALRIGDQMSDFDTLELFVALEQCQSWPLKTVMESYTLQTILNGLDKECSNRLPSFDQAELMRISFLMAVIIPKLKQSKLLIEFIADERMQRSDLVKYLLILGFHGSVDHQNLLLQDATNGGESLANLFHTANTEFQTFSPTELAVIYSGFRCLVNENSRDLIQLADRIKNKFGFRLK